MKRILTVAFASAALTLSCGDLRPYDNSDLQLAPAYGAKELCSCLFVMEMSEDYCRAWTKASPAVANLRIDREAKRVEGGALLMWGRNARYDDASFGCVLE